MGEKGEVFLTEEMEETDNQHLANVTLITASGRNHQGCQNEWVKCDEK